MSASPSAGARRRYRNPPIEEAACEFRFHPGRDWDLTIPGKLHTELADAYPGPPRDQKVLEVTVTPPGAPSPSVDYREGTPRVQLVTENARRLVGIGRNALTIHVLRPYQGDGASLRGWEAFRNRIESALDAYWRVAEPASIRRLALRYINRFFVPQGSPSIRAFLRGVPDPVPGLPGSALRYFGNGDYGDEKDIRYRVLHGISPPSNGHREVILDIEAAHLEESGMSRETGIEWVDRLQTREQKVFEAIITDQARSLFDAE